MALGSLLGFLFAKNNSNLKLIDNKLFVWVFIFLSVASTLSRFRFSYFNDEIFAILYGLLIISLAINLCVRIDNKITNFLGRISYGIYMYHWMVILFVLKFLPKLNNIIFYNILLYLFSFGLTILISWISFVTIEKKFLQLKSRYEVKY